MEDDLIGESLYNHYYEHKRKRGYHVIGWKIIVAYFILMIAMGVSAGWFVMMGNWWLALTFFLLFLTLNSISNKIDEILEEDSKQATPIAKDKIRKFLQNHFGFMHSKPYQELSLQLQKKAEESKRIYDLTPQINMILPVAVLLLSIKAQDLPGNFTEILLLASVLLIVSLSINPTINIFTEIFLNTKSEKTIELSRLLNEIYLDELIEENNRRSKDNQHDQNNFVITNYFPRASNIIH